MFAPQAEICGAPIKSIGKITWCGDWGCTRMHAMWPIVDSQPHVDVYRFQMQKYIAECYMRLIGKPIVQSIEDMRFEHTRARARTPPPSPPFPTRRCFLVECHSDKVEEAQMVLAIPSDQTIVTKVGTGLTNSDMKCVLDFFKRHNRKGSV